MQKEIKKNIEDSTIFVSDMDSNDFNDSVVANKKESDLIELDSVIDSLDSDQVIEQVKSYINVVEIPNLDIIAYINEGSDKAALSGGVGRHTSTANVGSAGNCVIAGHASPTYNCIFNRLEEIDILDEFYLYDSNGTKHRYYVTDKFICDPSNIDILYNSGEGVSTTTLYTCTNNGHQRFVVVGKELSDEELNQFKIDIKSIYVNNMLKMNDANTVETISYALSTRGLKKTRMYNFKFFNTDISRVRDTLYGVVLGSDAFDKEHTYNLDYSVNFGFTLNNF